MCVNVYMHFTYMILRTLYDTSFRIKELFANCQYEATLHILHVAWFMKFLITYMRIHGRSISSHLTAVVLQEKKK